MALFYQVFAQAYPAQGDRVIVHSFMFPVTAPYLPAPSLVHIGNFYTLRWYFPSPEQAGAWADDLKLTYSKGPAENPLLHCIVKKDTQLSLFDVSEFKPNKGA
ncbi:hypothetical protein FACS189476_00210 [Spirochaetia bacterium]|nr:hypothetical protein FACS189476_00210 [Spirochaetia bacterium]